MLPKKRSGDRETVRPSAIRHKSKPKPAKKKYKKRKSRWADIFDDAFDIIEDIFD